MGLLAPLKIRIWIFTLETSSIQPLIGQRLTGEEHCWPDFPVRRGRRYLRDAFRILL